MMAKRKPEPDSFEGRWIARQHDCGLAEIGPPTFLACGDAVLPSEAAPFLTFEEAQKMPRLWEVFGPNGSWSVDDKKRVSGYRMIGSDGSGNPFCVEEGTGSAWMLDHEDYFRTRQ